MYQKRSLAGTGQICFAQTGAGSGRPRLKRPGDTRTAQEAERSPWSFCIGTDIPAQTRFGWQGRGIFFDSIVKGAELAEGLQKALDVALANLPIARMMAYQLGDGWTTVDFVRPAHGLVALHGAEIVPVSVLGPECRA